MDPTPEQARAVELFKTGGSLAIEAGAGTGKTSTLVMIAKAAGPNRNGQYVAFNKALVEDSRPKFPLTVGCNTAHSLAFRAYGKEFQHRLNNSRRMFGREIAQMLGIGALEVMTFDGRPKTLAPAYLASLAGRAVTRFCQSSVENLTNRHVPVDEGLDAMSVWTVQDYVLPFAQAMWKDLQSLNGWVPYKHEHYLKGWQLRQPVIAADFILFDEAQDANPVIADIVAQQAARGTQLIYVGDSQQEIYAWTGAVNSLAKVEVSNRTYLTQSFRFGQAVADRANDVLTLLDSPLKLTGNPAIESTVESVDNPRAILVRKNATGVGMMLGMQENGRSVHFLGGTAELLSFARAANELMETGRTTHPELVLFDSWTAVQSYVSDKEESGEDLRLMVKLVDSFGADEVIRGIEQMPPERKAEVVISTAHKSKGREWQSVKIAGDFPIRADSNPSDLRLLYVAMTRAQKTLDDTALSTGEAESTDLVAGNEPAHVLAN